MGSRGRTIVLGRLSEDDLGGVVDVVGLLLLNNWGNSLDSAIKEVSIIGRSYSLSDSDILNSGILNIDY